MEQIAVGAEAKVYRDNDFVVKQRVPKKYRHHALDERIRAKRTKLEASVMKKLGSVAPEVHSVDDDTIRMDFVAGKTLDEAVTPETMRSVAEAVASIHDADVYHGDLTTHNVILTEKGVKIIDYGLAGHDARVEDKAVDLNVLRRALETRHHAVYEAVWETFLAAYQPRDKEGVLERFEAVKQRGRYK
jgi:Kae1-associated kinase Bud32